MTGAVRKEPPPAKSRAVQQFDWTAIAADLQADPGEWYLVGMAINSATAASTARYVRESAYKPLNDGRYEATSRTVDGEFRIYARYLGPA